MTGKKFGRLTVIREKLLSEYPNGKRPCVQWYCDCDCGTKNHLVDGTSLRAGRVKSCGCLTKDSARNNIVDITNQKFGMLTVIKRVDKPAYITCEMGAWWLCRCDCGNEKIASYGSLKSGTVKSCGCLISNGERLIREILIKNNVIFETQFQFNDLVSPITNRHLKFDFAIFNRFRELYCLIEFDGNQHYYGTRFSNDSAVNKEKFERLKLYDHLKNSYCLEHNIRLLRIPFFDLNNIEMILDKNLKEESYGFSSKES